MDSTNVSTDGIDDARERLQKRKRYNRLFGGLIGAGIVGYLALIGLWSWLGGNVLPVVAIAVYWGAFFAAIGVYYFGPVELEDERDKEIGNVAAGLTVYVFAFVLVLGGPGSVTLDQTGVYTVPDWFSGMMWGYVLLFIVYAIAHWYVKRQYA